ncbi:hypothetical protein [Cystobacter ferrugineus]|uniref:hypothetical protein n=1 Tax=Cystobacter ferrugineus TaxID=83449 RepID=UPI000B164F90|nr:hypothetical protein [Cystobacter ferrugineus]
MSKRLRRLLRGLSPRLEDRFPSMDTLLEEPRREAVGPRRRRALAGAALLGAVLAALGLVSMGAQARLMCARTVEKGAPESRAPFASSSPAWGTDALVCIPLLL